MAFETQSITQSGAASNLVLIESKAITTATQNIDFEDLDLNTDGAYLLLGELENTQGADATLYLYINDDYTATNYYSQRVESYATTINCNRHHMPAIAVMTASKDSTFKCYIQINNGFVTAISQCIRISDDAANCQFQDLKMAKTSSVVNVTDIRIHHNNGAYLKGNFTLYKLTRS